MKDSQGNRISIGDKVKVLWSYDNKIHTGKVVGMRDNVVNIVTINAHISTSDHKKITKI